MTDTSDIAALKGKPKIYHFSRSVGRQEKGEGASHTHSKLLDPICSPHLKKRRGREEWTCPEKKRKKKGANITASLGKISTDEHFCCLKWPALAA
jgi:hypothetical protein